MLSVLLFLFSLQGSLAPAAPSLSRDTDPAQPRHLVLVLLDDAPPLRAFADWHRLGGLDQKGVDADVSGIVPTTPVLDILAKQGRRFPHTYAMPQCSPTRASILSGVYPFRHGVGHVLLGEYAGELAEYGDEGFQYPSLPKFLPGGVQSGIVGKIHLSLPTSEQIPGDHGLGRWGIGWGILERLQFDFSATVLRNVYQDDGLVAGGTYYYYGHKRNAEEPRIETLYATSHQIDSAIEFMQGLGGERGFLTLAFNAAHSPWGPRNFPPSELVHTQAYLDAGEDLGAWPGYMASMEAIDTELGRLLASISPDVRKDTTFVVLSDNGPTGEPLADARDTYGLDLSPGWNRLVNLSRLKGTVYQWGVRTPMIWSGPTVESARVDNPGSASMALVDAVDLNTTIARYFDAEVPENDGVDFLDLAWHGGMPGEEWEHERQVSFSETFRPLGNADEAQDLRSRSLRARLRSNVGQPIGLFELVRRLGKTDEVYQLEDGLGRDIDPFEEKPLDINGSDRLVYLELLNLLDEVLSSSLQ